MTNLIMPSRRKFLFMAPAVIAVSSLMPGHSIVHLLPVYKHVVQRIYDDGYVEHLGIVDSVFKEISSVEFSSAVERVNKGEKFGFGYYSFFDGVKTMSEAGSYTIQYPMFMPSPTMAKRFEEVWAKLAG